MVKLLPYLEYMQVQPLLRPPECSPVVLIKKCETLYVYERRRDPPLGTLDIVQSVSNLSLHRGYPFIFLATQRIYNAFVWIMSVLYQCIMMR